MPSFAVRYRSRGAVREVRWTDGRMSAEPLIEVLVDMMIRTGQVIHGRDGAPARTAALDEAELAALTILEALYEVGAHIINWDGNPWETG